MGMAQIHRAPGMLRLCKPVAIDRGNLLKRLCIGIELAIDLVIDRVHEMSSSGSGFGSDRGVTSLYSSGGASAGRGGCGSWTSSSVRWSPKLMMNVNGVVFVWCFAAVAASR